MPRLSARYVGGRAVRLVLTVWISLTLMFAIPRLGASSPTEAILGRLLTSGGGGADVAAIANSYAERFGLHKPVLVQYLDYLRNSITFDFGRSLSQFPTTVGSMVSTAAPWTFGLVIAATLISFVLGTTIGALLGWARTPRWVRRVLGSFLVFSSLPSFMVGIVLLFFFAQLWPVLPFAGAYDSDVVAGFNMPFIGSVLRHSVLPLLSVVLVQMGGWAFGMRGMMITTAAEDHMVLAEAKGLRSRSIFLHYGVRAAILPQATSLGLALGTVAAGVVVVETVFAYPGLGNMLFQAVLANDYSLIEGIAYLLILGVAMSTFVLDLVYPFLDPRISYTRK
ncbi:ABC transporter permease [Actinocrispum wychmicini]|uniref:Peptide/nickel transport system permease protein n=1 Tax=Actinocrispum wychmicini TaxID=1213861 RepID=A0A4R2K447_9PSEU|nr:ABC transporter permease [Actinocrispum wychmicini]TCO61105.1 peptide/nickel transport system permease protein [Actinocrispum wychmicini]